MRRFSKSFSVDELACNDGTPVPLSLYANAEAICKRAQVLRDFLDKPLKVTSGYRTPDYNRKVGGAPNSLHVTASALDLVCHGLKAEELAEAYRGLVRIGAVVAGGLGIYPRDNGGWIHIDIGPDRTWTK